MKKIHIERRVIHLGQMKKRANRTQDNQQQFYKDIEQSSGFKALMQEKKRFIIPLTVFFLLFYFSLPVLASYTTILNNPAIGSITWAWILAIAQFIMTWTLCILYVRKAAQFDLKADAIIDEMEKGESK